MRYHQFCVFHLFVNRKQEENGEMDNWRREIWTGCQIQLPWPMNHIFKVFSPQLNVMRKDDKKRYEKFIRSCSCDLWIILSRLDVPSPIPPIVCSLTCNHNSKIHPHRDHMILFVWGHLNMCQLLQWLHSTLKNLRSVQHSHHHHLSNKCIIIIFPGQGKTIQD